MKTPIKLVSALLLLLLTAVARSVAVSDPVPTRCQQHFYTAPDGRLTPHLLGRVPKSAAPIVGFEIVRGQPLVALPRRLFGFTDQSVSELSVPEPVNGLSVDHASRLELQTSTGFQTVGDAGIEADKTMTSEVHGRLYGSGSRVFVEVRARQGVLQFVARHRSGRSFPIASFKGPLRAASWNEQGLAAIVGDSLYVWQPGGKNIVRLLTDRGLAAARDVVTVGDNRVVVALKTTVALVTPEAITIVAALPSVRCRFDHGTLYVLQESSGLIWSFKGLEKLGTKQTDEAFALGLLKQAENLPTKDGLQFQEAARILGCEDAGAKSNAHIGQITPKN